MRKKSIVVLLFISIVGILAYLGYSIVAKTNQKKVIAKQLQLIPEFELLTLHGELFTNKNLRPEAAIFANAFPASSILAAVL